MRKEAAQRDPADWKTEKEKSSDFIIWRIRKHVKVFKIHDKKFIVKVNKLLRKGDFLNKEHAALTPLT